MKTLLIFPLYREGDNEGPPYPVKIEDYENFLNINGFKLLQVVKVTNSIYIIQAIL